MCTVDKGHKKGKERWLWALCLFARLLKTNHWPIVGSVVSFFFYTDYEYKTLI